MVAWPLVHGTRDTRVRPESLCACGFPCRLSHVFEFRYDTQITTLPTCRVQSEHYRVSACFLRYIHGVFFSNEYCIDQRLPEEDGIDGCDEASTFLSVYEKPLCKVLSTIESHIQLLGQLAVESKPDLGTVAELEARHFHNEENAFSGIVLDIMLPFLRDLFRGGWLLELEDVDVMHKYEAKLIRAMDGEPSPSIEKLQEHQSRRGSSVLYSDAASSPATIQREIFITLRNIIRGLNALGSRPCCLHWEKAREAVGEVLKNCLDQPLSRTEPSQLLVPESSALYSVVLKVHSDIEKIRANLEKEGLSGVSGDNAANICFARREHVGT